MSHLISFHHTSHHTSHMLSHVTFCRLISSHIWWCLIACLIKPNTFYFPHWGQLKIDFHKPLKFLRRQEMVAQFCWCWLCLFVCLITWLFVCLIKRNVYLLYVGVRFKPNWCEFPKTQDSENAMRVIWLWLCLSACHIVQHKFYILSFHSEVTFKFKFSESGKTSGII